jgi:2,4-dienoyl-CoA reductase-like NADH-dependent reductase (Old Yellow Enzyme family)
VARAVRRAVGDDFSVGIRIFQAKVNDPDHAWSGGESDAAAIFGSLTQNALDYIHVTEPEAAKPAFGEDPTLAMLARKYADGPTIIANGTLDDPQVAESAIREEADLVVLGKGALANMDWPSWVREERPSRTSTRRYWIRSVGCRRIVSGSLVATRGSPERRLRTV